MLQKPSRKSKAKENSEYLAKRLILWSEGKIKNLIAESKEIQKKVKEQFDKKTELKEQAFCRLMLLGKVGQAMKYINNEDQTLGVHVLSETIKDLLQLKHPKGREAAAEILLPETVPEPLPV